MNLIKPTLTINQFEIYKDALGQKAQADLVGLVRECVKQSPLYQPTMPKTGKPLNVKMTNLGDYGWVSDRSGYRYQPNHPVTNEPWPQMPEAILEIWRKFTQFSAQNYGQKTDQTDFIWPEPECCLVNHYLPENKMGMHIDMDEKDHITPVLSISLGDDALFRMGGYERGGKTQSVRLSSGDLVVFADEARLKYHGVSRVYGSTSNLLSKPGRLNLTLRRVSASD